MEVNPNKIRAILSVLVSVAVYRPQQQSLVLHLRYQKNCIVLLLEKVLIGVELISKCPTWPLAVEPGVFSARPSGSVGGVNIML